MHPCRISFLDRIVVLILHHKKTFYTVFTSVYSNSNTNRQTTTTLKGLYTSSTGLFTVQKKTQPRPAALTTRYEGTRAGGGGTPQLEKEFE
jgi:hypothetical protein